MRIFFFLSLFFLLQKVKAESCDSVFVFITTDSVFNTPGFSYELRNYSFFPINNSVSIPIKKENKKLIAAILAFPFPFGILGLHRIYLGTKPYMPFVYVGTLGGCFGILPLIDFIAILAADDKTMKNYENSPKVFMWTH